MSSKETIINQIKANVAKRTPVDLPKVVNFSHDNLDLLALFKKTLENAAGTWHEVNSIEEAQAIMEKQLPDAKVICSATDEWQGNKDLSTIQRPQDLQDVDIGVIRAQFGVAEMGSVWLTNADLQVNSLGFLSQHLVILLDPKEITENMHTAYQKINLPDHQYGCFMMGPSATGDIEGILIHGAQGARTLTLFFI